MLRNFRNLWRNVVHRRRIQRDLSDEIDGAFESMVDDLVRKGHSLEEARRLATLDFGRVEVVGAQVKDVRAGAQLDALLQDVRFGVRLLFRAPIFAVFTVASLALGIGATGAIFSVFDRLVLRQLPVPHPEQLVVASFGGPNGRYNYSLPYPHFEAMRTHSTKLSGLLALYPFGRVTVTARGEAAMAEGVYVTGDYYRVLGITPAVGRLLQPADDRAGETPAVLNYDYWQRRFSASPGVIGAPVTLNGRAFTIVGVEPAGFHGTEAGRPYDIVIPMRAIEVLQEGRPLWDEAFATWIYIMGRLKPGATLSEAEAEAKTIFAQVGVDAARTPVETRLARENQLRLESAATGNESDLRHEYERPLRLLLIVLVVVLVLASLNVATLLLSRSDARQREITTRLALGAGRARIVRQLLTESLVLATLAGAIGLALASWGSHLLLRMAVPSRDRLPLDLTLDLRLLAFVGGVTALTCLLFGLLPAIRSTSTRRLLTNRQIGGGRQRRTLDRALVVSQVALSLVLLMGAGLFLRTLAQLWSQDTGYDRRNVLMFSVDARLAGKTGADVPATYRRLLDALATVPGVRRATVSAVRPVSDSYYFISSVRRVGDKILSNEQRIRVAFNNVAPGYFGTLGIPLVAGRDFDDRDLPETPKVAIISERMARHFAGNPVGQRIGGPQEDDAREVVGVAKDMRYANIKDAPREVLYFPMFQGLPLQFGYTPTFEIRYDGAVSDLARLVREQVNRVDSGLEMFAVRTLEAQTEVQLSRERLLALLTTYFGLFALVLACIGLYGVMSDRVSLRTAEIGLRVALGAQAGSVHWLILREATITVLIGGVVGLAGSMAAASVVRSQLFGVEPHDPLALAGASFVLVALAGIAAYLPARRASRIDPLAALRHE